MIICINTFNIILPTSLNSVFGVSLCGGGNFMGVLCIRATMLFFLQVVDFAQSSVILLLLRRFRNVAKRDYWRLSVFLSVLNKSAPI